MLESLEREYRREEDWCSSESVAASSDKSAAMEQLILKHQEKKEAFLKVGHHGYLGSVVMVTMRDVFIESPHNY